MEDEIKKVDGEETTTTAAPAEEKKPDTTVDDDSIDYKAETERLKKRLGKAEHTIVELKKKKSDDDNDNDNDNDAKDNPEPVDISRAIEEIKSSSLKEIEKIKTDLVKDTIDDVLGSLTSNPDERELIKLIYDNRIVKKGFDKASIIEDLTSAQLLANKPKLETRISEMKAALSAETAKNKGGSATGQKVDTTPSKLSDTEEAWVKAHSAKTGIPEEKIRAKLIANKNSN